MYLFHPHQLCGDIPGLDGVPSRHTHNGGNIMKDTKLIGLVLLVVGIVLLYFGWQSSESLGDQLTEAVTGRFTDDTMFFIIGGAVAIAAGLFMSVARK
jgi:drug/metabolite transporter (DMT)-like permease